MCKMDVSQLISLVRARRAIWDQKDYNYKNRDVVRLLWEEVAVELSRPCKYLLYSTLTAVQQSGSIVATFYLPDVLILAGNNASILKAC